MTGLTHDSLPKSTTKTRVLVYLDAENAGGAEVTLSQIMARLPERFDLSILATERTVNGDAIARWLASHRPGTSFQMIEPIDGARDVRNMWAHRQAIRALEPDILHFSLSSMSSCQWPIAVAETLPDVKVLVVENSPMRSWSNKSTRLKKVTSRFADAHVAVGERTCRIIEEAGGLPTGSIETLYHGVAEVARDIPREGFDGPVVVNVARHDPVKGVDVLLEAMALLPEEVSLVQIGSGLCTDDLFALCSKLGLDDRVEFRQLPLGEPAADQIAAFDLFVLPSRLEGLPVTVMEAMLAGLAIVSTEVGSIREQITDGESGLIVPREDPPALAAAIAELLADPERRAEMGRRNREKAEQMFTIDATVHRYVRVYDTLKNRSGGIRRRLTTREPLGV
jgi:glycosyltransferase involved in cell wall biosynthesis